VGARKRYIDLRNVVGGSCHPLSDALGMEFCPDYDYGYVKAYPEDMDDVSSPLAMLPHSWEEMELHESRGCRERWGVCFSRCYYRVTIIVRVN
jgi:hypothetical protein